MQIFHRKNQEGLPNVTSGRYQADYPVDQTIREKSIWETFEYMRGLGLPASYWSSSEGFPCLQRSSWRLQMYLDVQIRAKGAQRRC